MAPAWDDVTEDAPLNPSTPYAASKAAADFLLKTYAKQFGFPLAHGAGHERLRSPAATLQNHPALGHLPETRPDDRTARRRPGGEVVHPHPRRVARRESSCSNAAASGELYHLSPDSGVAVRTVVQTICDRLGKRFEDATRSVDERPGQDAAYVIDSTKARTELGWQADDLALKTGLDRGRGLGEWVLGRDSGANRSNTATRVRGKCGTCRICGRDGIRERLDFGPQAIRNRFLRSAGARPSSLTRCTLGCLLRVRHGATRSTRRRSTNSARGSTGSVTTSRTPSRRGRGSRSRSCPASRGVHVRRADVQGRLHARPPESPRVRRHLAAGHQATTSASTAPIQRHRVRAGEADAVRSPPELAAKFGQPGRAARPPRPRTHARHPRRALNWAATLVRPAATSCSRSRTRREALERLDYTTVWEEHILYFTPARRLRELSRTRTASRSCRWNRIPYTLEDSLVAIVPADAGPRDRLPSPVDPRATLRGHSDSSASSPSREGSRTAGNSATAGRIAMLGAGHLTGAFVNLVRPRGSHRVRGRRQPEQAGAVHARLAAADPPLVGTREPRHRPVPDDRAARDRGRGRGEERGLHRPRRGLASVFPDSPYSLDDSNAARGGGMTVQCAARADEVLVADGRRGPGDLRRLAEVARRGVRSPRKRCPPLHAPDVRPTRCTR